MHFAYRRGSERTRHVAYTQTDDVSAGVCFFELAHLRGNARKEIAFVKVVVIAVQFYNFTSPVKFISAPPVIVTPSA